MLSRKKILLCIFIFAAAVRGIFACVVSGSMFRSYHLVPGLDMQTLLRFSEWGSPAELFPPFLSPHRVLLYINWLCHGYSHGTWSIFAVQAILGILAALAAADLTLSLTGKRRGALAAGLIFAAYLPFLVYEFSILQDAVTVYLTLFALWGTVSALKRRFAVSWAVSAGVLWSFALSGRPTAILFALAAVIWSAYKMYRCGKLRRFAVFAVTLAVLLTGYSGFNRSQGWDFSPFYPVMGYAREFNASADGIPASEMTVLFNSVCRSPWLFAAYERMENQNIYFWCEKCPELNFLIAPGLLVPAAAAAFMILLAAGYGKKQIFWYIAVPVAALALPLCAREVIGRYRLMLIPYFIMAAVMAFYAYKKLDIRRKFLALLLGGAAAAASIYFSSSMPRSRTADLHAWALAKKHTPGVPAEEVIAAYVEYWQADKGSEKAFVSVMDCLLAYRQTDMAAVILDNAPANGISGDLTGYFRMWLAVMQNDPERVKSICDAINPAKLPPEQRKIFLRVRRDTVKLLHKRKK